MLVNAHHYFVAAGDPSVGLYLYIAKLWLHGRLPYVDAWEYKPPGLFAYLAVALALTGERATFAIELLTTLSTFVTAVLLWRLADLLDPAGAGRTGRYAALFFVMLAPENEGYLGDAEVLLAPFVTAAYVIACEKRSPLRAAAIAGLLAGCALQMKLSALPIVVIPAFVLARSSGKPLRVATTYACAVIVPFVCEVALYARAAALPAFVDANLGATIRRATGLRGGIASQNLVWFRAQLRELAPALELAVLAVFAKAGRRRGVAWAWLAAALVSIVAVGEFYDRQFVLAEPPVALLGAMGLRVALEYLAAYAPRRRGIAVTIVFLITFALHDYWETAQALGIAYHRDVRREAAYRAGEYAEALAALRARPLRSLFVIQLSPLLYADAGLPSPTRFPYTDHLLDARLAAMTGVPGRPELARIFAQRPRVVIAGKISEPRFDPAAVRFVLERLARDYRPLERVGERTTIYVRDPPDVAPKKPKRSSTI